MNYNRIFGQKTAVIVQDVKIWKNCRIWLRFAEKNVYNNVYERRMNKEKRTRAWVDFLESYHNRIAYLIYFLEWITILIWEPGAEEWRYMERMDLTGQYTI